MKALQLVDGARGDARVIRIESRGVKSPPREIAEALGMGEEVTDRAFDRHLELEHEQSSSIHWTPVAVALTAARWLDQMEIQSVVDIGAGVGKFCVAAALAGSCKFIGIEQRPRFVAAARALAQTFEVESRVQFVEGALTEIPLPSAEAYYLFNPFGENLFGPEGHLDAEVELSAERHARDVAAVEGVLFDLRPGTYVITYNGFGGRVPDSFREVRVDRNLPNLLKMWRKERPRTRRRVNDDAAEPQRNHSFG